MNKFLSIFTPKDIFNLCYSIYLTNIIDINTFPTDELKEKYYNLSCKDRETLDIILNKLIKNHRKALASVYHAENNYNYNSLNLLKIKIMKTLYNRFKFICHYKL